MKLVEYLLTIIDYDFVRKTHVDLQTASNEDIEAQLKNSIGTVNIIVSNQHCRFFTLNDFFEYDFYQTQVDPNKLYKPFELLEWYILNDNVTPLPVCQAHASFLKQTPLFNINVYRTHPDLAHFKPSYLIHHYIKYGKKENRVCC